MNSFRIEVNFLGLSKKAVTDVLQISKKNRNICYDGSWELRRKGSGIGPNDTRMVSYQLVTPQIDIYHLDVLKEDLTSLYEEAGCIILDDEPVKIYFKRRFRYGLARKIIYELVSDNKFMYTFVMHRKHFSKFRFASYEIFFEDAKFVPYSTYFNTIKNGYNTLLVEELISEIILKGSRPE